jgi:hypothetical protein
MVAKKPTSRTAAQPKAAPRRKPTPKKVVPKDRDRRSNNVLRQIEKEVRAEERSAPTAAQYSEIGKDAWDQRIAHNARIDALPWYSKVLAMRLGRRAPRFGTGLLVGATFAIGGGVATAAAAPALFGNVATEAKEAGVIPGQSFTSQLGKDGNIRSASAFYDLKKNKLTLREFGDFNIAPSEYVIKVILKGADGALREVQPHYTTEGFDVPGQTVFHIKWGKDEFADGDSISGLSVGSKSDALSHGKSMSSPDIQVILVGAEIAKSTDEVTTTLPPVSK